MTLNTFPNVQARTGLKGSIWYVLENSGYFILNIYHQRHTLLCNSSEIITKVNEMHDQVWYLDNCHEKCEKYTNVF